MESALFVHTDCESIYSKLKQQETLLRLKKRWLTGLALSESDLRRLKEDGITFTNQNENDKKFPESFLRQDDVLYDTVNEFVNKGFVVMIGGRDYHDVTQNNLWTIDIPNHITEYISLLDDMTNNSLQLVAQLLTDGSLKFDKTRWKMKKIIKQHLPQLLRNIKNKEEERKVQQLCDILKNPQNFRANISKSSSHADQKLHAAVIKVLDGLEDLDSLALSAMHRKLRGIEGYIPQLLPKKSGWVRSLIIEHLRNMCMQMLSELDENDELQEPLAKAMAVATLSSNLIYGSSSVVEFRRFSSEIIALQNEITKAVSLLDGRGIVRYPELKKVQIILDPNATLTKRSLRPAVKNLLEEYLYECGDLDPIPEFLFEALSIINGTNKSAPYNFISEEEIAKDVENVLSVSAQMKQILWDWLPEYGYDQDFDDAYMEDLEDSDNDSSDDAQGFLFANGGSFCSIEGDDQTEATGETSPVHCNDFSARVERQECRVNPEKTPELSSSDLDNRFCTNHYLDVQEACDKTSLVAYQLIGCLLEKFAQKEGLDFDSADASYLRGENLSCSVALAAKEDHISYGKADNSSLIVQVLEELIPSFPESGKEKLKELMSLK